MYMCLDAYTDIYRSFKEYLYLKLHGGTTHSSDLLGGSVKILDFFSYGDQ
jgi:hypothetical protein